MTPIDNRHVQFAVVDVVFRRGIARIEAPRRVRNWSTNPIRAFCRMPSCPGR